MASKFGATPPHGSLGLQPCTAVNSSPEMFTPRSCTVLPLPSTSLLPLLFTDSELVVDEPELLLDELELPPEELLLEELDELDLPPEELLELLEELDLPPEELLLELELELELELDPPEELPDVALSAPTMLTLAALVCPRLPRPPLDSATEKFFVPLNCGEVLTGIVKLLPAVSPALQLSAPEVAVKFTPALAVPLNVP